MLRIPFLKPRRMPSAVRRFDPPTLMSTVGGFLFESHPPHQIPLQDGRVFHQEKTSIIDHEKVCMVEPLSCRRLLPWILKYD